MGKSRLVWELTRSHRTQGCLVLESGSVSYGKATPYLPVIDLLKAYCAIQERDDLRAIRERVAGKLLTLDRALEPLLTPLLALLDVPVEEAAWDTLDPPQRRQRTLDAVKRLLLRESQVQPLDHCTGIVRMGAPSLPSVSTRVKMKNKKLNSRLDGMSRSSIQNQCPR